jgi:hypothetical protein
MAVGRYTQDTMLPSQFTWLSDGPKSVTTSKIRECYRKDAAGDNILSFDMGPNHGQLEAVATLNTLYYIASVYREIEARGTSSQILVFQ